MKFLHFVIIIQNQFLLRKMEKATLQLWVLKPTKILPAALSYTAKLRKEWMMLHQVIPNPFLKLWQISGVAAHDELSVSYHIHHRAWYYTCCGDANSNSVWVFLSHCAKERKESQIDVETNVLSIKKNAQKPERNLYYPNFLRMLSNCVFVISSFSV